MPIHWTRPRTPASLVTQFPLPSPLTCSCYSNWEESLASWCPRWNVVSVPHLFLISVNPFSDIPLLFSEEEVTFSKCYTSVEVAERMGMRILYCSVILTSYLKCCQDPKWTQYLLRSIIKASHLIAFQFHLCHRCLIDASCCTERYQQTCGVFCPKKKRNGQWSLGSSSQESTIYKANKQVQNINSGAPTQTK